MRLVSAVAGFALLAAASAALAQRTQTTLTSGETLLEVHGEGVQRSRPDMMRMAAGIVTRGNSAGEALRSNSAVAARMIAAVRAIGVEARDVQTAELSIEPRFESSGDDHADDVDRRITGYLARNRLTVRLRDVARASDLMDTLIQAGANSVEGPTFSLADDTASETAARRNAVADARAKAETHAESLGMRIARVLRVAENASITSVGIQELTDRSSSSIEAGEIETRVRVQVEFALVPR